MGRVASAGDNAAMESFWALLQRNVLDSQTWRTREDLHYAIAHWIEHTYNRRRMPAPPRQTHPVEYELAFTHTNVQAAAWTTNQCQPDRQQTRTSTGHRNADAYAGPYADATSTDEPPPTPATPPPATGNTIR